MAPPPVSDRLLALLGEASKRERYLSIDEAAEYTGRPSPAAFRKWAQRAQVPLRRAKGFARGRLTVKKSDIDYALQVKR